MKISTHNRINNYIFNNALNIIRNTYNNDQSMLPIVMKCTFHDGIIRSLQHAGMLGNMVFHGGTSLQRIYKSPRLSEDLDFCAKHDISEFYAFKKFCKNFETCIRQDFAKSYHVDDDDIFYRDPKKDMSIAQKGDTFTWKISIAVNLGSARQLIKVDLENRQPLTCIQKKFDSLPNDSIFYDDVYLNVESPEEMLVNKFISLFQRNRIQYRDFFDIGFLSKLSQEFNFDFLVKKINSKFEDGVFLKKINERINLFYDINELSKKISSELERFFPKNSQSFFSSNLSISNTRDYIFHNIEKYKKYCHAFQTNNATFTENYSSPMM